MSELDTVLSFIPNSNAFSTIFSDHGLNVDSNFTARLTKIFQEWIFEVSMSYGMSHLPRLQLPLLVIEQTPEINGNAGLIAKSKHIGNSNQRRIFFVAHYLMNGESSLYHLVTLTSYTEIYCREMPCSCSCPLPNHRSYYVKRSQSQDISDVPSQTKVHSAMW